MTVGFPINPPNAPIAFPDGRCTTEWWKYFLAIQKMIGGPSDPFEDVALLSYQARQAFDGDSDFSDTFLGAPAARGVDYDDLLSPYPSGFLTRITQDEADARYARQGHGTAFPGSPAANDQFYRTDRNILYFYDGTRWLSTQLMSIAIGEGVSASATGTQYHAVPWSGLYDIYLDSFSYTSFRTAAGEWDITINWVSAANANTLIATVDGNGTATSTWLAGTVAIGSVLSSSARSLSMVRTNVSGAASFFATVEIFYRLVG